MTNEAKSNKSHPQKSQAFKTFARDWPRCVHRALLRAQVLRLSFWIARAVLLAVLGIVCAKALALFVSSPNLQISLDSARTVPATLGSATVIINASFALLVTLLLATLVLTTVLAYTSAKAARLAKQAISTQLLAMLDQRLAQMCERTLSNFNNAKLLRLERDGVWNLALFWVDYRPIQQGLLVLPLVITALILPLHWPTAALLWLCFPVLILFYILLGTQIKQAASAQQQSLERLEQQFSDRIKGLPSITALGWQSAEQQKLARRSQLYAQKALQVMHFAFLNAGVLDFFSSLSIAMLAVFFGLGHLGLATMVGFDGQPFWISLCVLLLAAEFFAPFKRLSEAYHLNTQGLEAAKELRTFLDAANEPLPLSAAQRLALGQINDFVTSHQQGLVVISGASGSGKSTLLRLLSGQEQSSAQLQINLPQIKLPAPWVLADETSYLPPNLRPQDLQLSADLQPFVPALLPEPRFTALVNANTSSASLIERAGQDLSGGQRKRLGLLLALSSNAPCLLLDEPTAKLNNLLRHQVISLLEQAAQERLILVASHDHELIAKAQRHIRLSHAKEPV